MNPLLQLDSLGSCRSTYNWRVQRLLKTGHIKTFAGFSWQGARVYFITAYGLAELESHGESLTALSSQTRQSPDPSRAVHSLELNSIRLALARQALLVHWLSEVEVSSANALSALVSTEPYAKNYDAIVKVWVGNEMREFALEYERSLKNSRQYEKISATLDGEQRVACVLYLTPNTDVLFGLLRQLTPAIQRVAFATASSFELHLLETTVATDDGSGPVTLEQFLRYAHPLYIPA